MNQLPKSIMIGLVAFLASAALAFWIGGNLGSDDAIPEAAMPAFDEPLPVIVPIPFEGDPAAAAQVLAEQANASRVLASEIGVTLEPTNPSNIEIQAMSSSTAAEPAEDDPEPSSPSAPGTTTTGDTPGTTAPGTTTTGNTPGTTAPGTTTTSDTPGTTVPGTEEEPPAPAGDARPAEETAIDLCVEGGEGCPEGISGTVLALHSLPPLQGFAQFRPPATPFRASSNEPVCPPRAEEEGTAYFGVSTSRPALITMEYKTWEWRSREGAIPWTTVSLATSAEADAAWAALDTIDPTDSVPWIQTCFTLEDLPPRADYVAKFSYADKDDPSLSGERRGPRLVNFVVPGRDSLDPGAQRRPTTLVPVGIDQLMVGMTSEPDQTVAVTARQGTDIAVCDIAGDTPSIYSGAGTIRPTLGATGLNYISDNPIDPAVLNDPAYPYLAEHTRSVVFRLDLEEGTNYVVCVYWLSDGPAFDPTVVDISEAIPVSTPEAYRPTVILHSAENLFGGADSFEVSVPGCGGLSADLTGEALSGPIARWEILPPLELCTLNDGLTEIDRRGIRVDTRATAPDGTTYSGGAYIRTDLDCPATCLVRLPEMALIPLPRVPADDSDCGSGFGTGCLSDGLRSAGDVTIEIQYDFSAGSRSANWSIGDAAEFDETAPALGEVPQIDVQTTVDLIDAEPANGAQATVTVVADRPVTLSVEATSNGDPCTLGDPGGYDSTTLSATHTFTLGPLCLGYEYLLAVDASDESGRTAEIIGGFPGLPEGLDRLYVPPVSASTELSVTITAPTDGLRHSVYVRPVQVRSNDPTRESPFISGLGWTWPISDRNAAARAGWQMFGVDGQANACGTVEAGPLEVSATRTRFGFPLRGTALVTQDGVEVTMRVDIYDNQPLGGIIVGECVPGDIVENVELTATVSIEDFFDGITLSSESGSVVFNISVAGFRSELIG